MITIVPPDNDDYWRRALALEAADRLEEAERVVQEALAARGHPWPARIAHLYELRLRRLRAAGGSDATVRDAYDRAVSWIDAYAAGATSGGEGAALSYEAKHFKAGLGERPA